MDQFVLHIQYLVAVSQQNSVYLLTLIGGLWAINLLNWAIGSPLHFLGLIPRSLNGLVGIFVSPFLHGNANHLFFNCIPLFLLANFVMLEGLDKFYQVTAIIIVVCGSCVWLFARMGNHIGASGVILGYWSYLLINALHTGTLLAVVLGIVVIYYFGGMALSVLPGKVKESWEAHLFGAVGGIVAAYVLS